MPDLDLTPEEIGELACAAREAYHGAIRTVLGTHWHKVVLAVLRKRQEQALERLARDLENPDSAASKLRDELRGLRCPHCGQRLEEEPEERDGRDPV